MPGQRSRHHGPDARKSAQGEVMAQVLSNSGASFEDRRRTQVPGVHKGIYAQETSNARSESQADTHVGAVPAACWGRAGSPDVFSGWEADMQRVKWVVALRLVEAMTQEPPARSGPASAPP